MADGFWKKLKKPILVMAPMANVTDFAFRTMFAKYGKPDVIWTEFVSADGLVSPGRENLLIDLKFSPKERPIIAQLFTGHPEAMKRAAALVQKLGFDGIDINMGCPDRAVERQGGGAASMRDPARAIAVLHAAREGAPKLPVTVKTRIGYNRYEPEWLKAILREHVPVLTIHLRTRKEMSDVAAHWDLMPEIVKMRDEISPETLIIGNGDVESPDQARGYCLRYGCDGVMIGRGIFGRPWLFEKKPKERMPGERLKIMVEHAKLFEKHFKGIKSFAVMRKHFKAYVHGWDGAKELRVKLMEAEGSRAVASIVKRYLAESSEESYK